MLYLYAVARSVAAYALEPIVNAGKKLYAGAVIHQRFTGKEQLSLRLAEHDVHIGEVLIHAAA